MGLVIILHSNLNTIFHWYMYVCFNILFLFFIGGSSWFMWQKKKCKSYPIAFQKYGIISPRRFDNIFDTLSLHSDSLKGQVS